MVTRAHLANYNNKGAFIIWANTCSNSQDHSVEIKGWNYAFDFTQTSSETTCNAGGKPGYKLKCAEQVRPLDELIAIVRSGKTVPTNAVLSFPEMVNTAPTTWKPPF